jgi:hypothetical protein
MGDVNAPVKVRFGWGRGVNASEKWRRESECEHE